MLNQVQLIGFTGAEAEIRTTQTGRKVAILRVATNRYAKKAGEKKDYTTWHTVEIWNSTTIDWLLAKPLAKGSRVFVQGEIRLDRYVDRDDQERTFSKIIITAPRHTLQALDRPESSFGEEG